MKWQVPLLLALLAFPQDSLEERVRRLVDRLGAEEIVERERAVRDLVGLGEPALPALEKAGAASADAETVQRLKTVVEQIRRNAVIAKASPPARPVTVSAKDQPLKAFLEDLAVQSGVECACVDAVADRPVTLEAKDEPLLKVLDQACLARGDIAIEMVEGKIRIANGTPRKTPAAYSGPFRLRVTKVALQETNTFAERRANLIVFFQCDGQPDQKFKSALPREAPEAVDPAGAAVKLRRVSEGPVSMWTTSTRGTVVVDEVAITYDEGDSFDGICFVKDAPADLRTLSSVKVKARYRFAIGNRPVRVELPGGVKRMGPMGDLPYQIHNAGQLIYILPAAAGGRSSQMGPPLEDLIDMSSVKVVDSKGTDNPVTAMPRPGRTLQYQWRVDRDISGGGAELRFDMVEMFDRDVDFELKDVKLRE
jgi:hypothetical protein